MPIKLCYTKEYSTYFKDFQEHEDVLLFNRFDDIEQIVNAKVDEKYRHFLAQPYVENDSIAWYSIRYKEMPQLLSELQGEDHLKYEHIKNETLKHYESVVNILRQEGQNSEANTIEKSIKFVNDDFVYCFDDKTVLGVWGMRLREEVREPIGTVVINSFAEKNTIRFYAGKNGILIGNSELIKNKREIIAESEIPQVEAKEGYKFTHWEPEPKNHKVTGDAEFTAKYEQLELSSVDPVHNTNPDNSINPRTGGSINHNPGIDTRPGYRIGTGPNLPQYKRFLCWLKEWLVWLLLLLTSLVCWFKGLFAGEGCLLRLLWLLLFLAFLLLLCLLFRGCRGNTASPIPYPIGDKPWVHDGDQNVGHGGIYDPGNPYKPVPTPPEYGDVLPPYQGTLPPVDSIELIRDPENPDIVGNRLNILMENEDKSIMDLAKDFKVKYPENKYKVVYYDDIVKRMQIEVPNEERARLKEEIPGKFAPEYELFVFDEALFRTGYTPNDPFFSDPNKSWYLRVVNAPQAWDITKGSGGKKLTIAIVDNGFSLNHPELSNKVVMPYNVWTHSKDVFPNKDGDHGTHVAGIALAIMDNGIGIAGIAPEAAFMPVQVANENGVMTTTSILDGILYALYQGADVVNVSLGTKFPSNLPENIQRDMQDNRFKEEERLWNRVMKISNKHKAIIVLAAGNDNMLAGVDPMNRPKNFIIVSAVGKDNREFRKTGFSNYGEHSTISAPGVDIYSTVGKKNYKAMDGTSMAAPIVSGAVALMKNLNENLTAEQIICILQETGLPANGKIGNIIQIDKALQKVQSGEYGGCTNRPETPSTGDVQVLLSWNNYNDLDLACIDPNGDKVWFQNKRVPSGGILEIDMNVQPFDSKTPIENIYWPQGGAPNGTYEVYLWLYKQHETNINETPYTITVKYGDKTEKFTGTIKKEDGPIHVTSFILGNVDSNPNPNLSNPNLNLPNTPPSAKSKEKLLKEREQFQRKLEEIDRELSKFKASNKKE